MSKKSNDPEGAREARRKNRGDWDRITARAEYRIPGGRTAGQEYNRITSTALLKWRAHGRRAAIEYLSANRPWLIQYADRIGAGQLPSSGTILDSLILIRGKEKP